MTSFNLSYVPQMKRMLEGRNVSFFEELQFPGANDWVTKSGESVGGIENANSGGKYEAQLGTDKYEAQLGTDKCITLLGSGSKTCDGTYTAEEKSSSTIGYHLSKKGGDNAKKEEEDASFVRYKLYTLRVRTWCGNFLTSYNTTSRDRHSEIYAPSLGSVSNITGSPRD